MLNLNCILLLLLTTFCLANHSLAESVSVLHHQGADAYDAGNYEQALELFSQAVTKKPEDSTTLFNQGTALYKLGRFGEATQAFATSAEANKKPKARAKAEYNKGRALLAQAGEIQDPTKKRELLLTGNQAFQQALRDDPRLKAARKGIADFRHEYAKINQPPSSCPQGQEQQTPADQGQEQQDLQDQLNKAGQQQQDMANQSKEASSANSQEGLNQEQLEDMAAQQQSVRQALEKIKEELSKEQANQADGDQGSKNLAKELEQAINEQKKAEESLNQGDLSQAQEHQQQAADNLSEMAANLATDQENTTEQSASAKVTEKNQETATGNAALANDQHVENQAQMAEKNNSTMADILDGEKALHEMRRLRLKQQRPTSGKDW